MLNDSRLAYVLVEQGILNNTQVEKVLEIYNQKPDKESVNLIDILVAELGISYDSIIKPLADLYAFRTFDIDPVSLSEEQIERTRDILLQFPNDIREQLLNNRIVPYKYNLSGRNKLIVLAANPMDKLCSIIPKQSDFKRYEVVYTPRETVDELILLVDPRQNEYMDVLGEVDEVMEISEDTKVEDIDETVLNEEINKSLLVNLYEGALLEAVRKGASDIHIIPGGKSSVELHFRVDGKLQLWFKKDNIHPEAFSAVVKDRSKGIDRFERDNAQDGFAQRKIDGVLIRFRISVVPIVSEELSRRFESIVIRIIDDRNVITDFTKLGFQKYSLEKFLQSINTSKGMIIVTGPTGSGKSTSLLAALHHVINPTRNVLTCEDPVEYRIKGARQLKIGHKMDFNAAIRAILRHDPDIVMVGEIRDRLTAEVGVKLANTGHLTFSTLHTNDAPSAVSRLYKMGIEPFLLANSINIITAQRLVRKLCQSCKKTLSKENEKFALELGLTRDDIESGIIFEPGPGCPKCTMGYKGRVNITEALYFSPDVKKEILNSGTDINEDRIKEIALGEGMLTLLDSGIDRIRNGLTSIEEIAYVASE